MCSKVYVTSDLKKYAWIKDLRVLGLLECRCSKSNSNLMQECFQKCCDDLNNTSIPYWVCLNTWPCLEMVGSLHGVLTANSLLSGLVLCDSGVPDEGWVFGHLIFDILDVFRPSIVVELLSNSKLDSDLLYKAMLHDRKRFWVKQVLLYFGVLKLSTNELYL